jgi:hypothetical protein
LAHQTWADTIIVFRRVRWGSSWIPITAIGCDSFIDKITETISSVMLNYVQAELKEFDAVSSNSFRTKCFAGLTSHHFKQAERVLEKGYWKDDYIWRPTDVHLAKLRYRQAQFCKRLGPLHFVKALRHINLALELLPHDPVLLREREAILGLQIGDQAWFQ